MPSIDVQKINHIDSKYKVDNYSRGTIIELEKCDYFDWCKVKQKELFVPKYALRIMNIPHSPFDNYVQLQNNKTNTVIAKKSTTKPKPCIKLIKIDLNEYKILSNRKKNKIFDTYYNQCINQKLIKNIVSDISKSYSYLGYVTTKPYLFNQNINDGQIDINVSTGLIENIIHSETNESSSKITTAFLFLKNKPLNLRELETSLESMNQVPSTSATFKIKPGSKQGYSLITINSKLSNSLHATFGISDQKILTNKPMEEENNPNLTMNISYDNLFNINDIITFTLNGSRIQEEYQSSQGKDLKYSFPLGSYMYELAASNTTYKQGVVGLNGTYLSEGDTNSGKIKISKILFRNQKNKLKTSATINHKNSKNYFENSLIEVSSYKTTQAQIDLGHTYLNKWGSINSTYSLYKGLDLFGARKDEYNDQEIDTSTQSKFEFLKHIFNLTLNHTFFRTYNIESKFVIQKSNDFLYNNDKLSVGSAYTVRGYSSSNYYGNNGSYLHNTFTKRFNIPKYLQHVSPYIGMDYGDVECQDDNIYNCGNLYGAAIGFKIGTKYFESDFMWSKPYKELSETFKEQILFRYNVTFKY